MSSFKINLRPETEPALVHDYPDAFMLALVHELRNPLASIDLSVSILERGPDEQQAKIYLGIIKRNSMLINELTKKLLISKVIDNLLPDTYSMHGLLNEIIEMSGDRIILKQVSVSYDYMAEDRYILSNREKMKVALTNIVVNAIEAVKFAEGRLTIRTKLVRGRYAIEIEDNGCGISPADLKNIFKPSFTKKKDGLGLGLATTYDIFRTKSVELKVTSALGKGTRFVILLQKHHLTAPTLVPDR